MIQQLSIIIMINISFSQKHDYLKVLKILFFVSFQLQKKQEIGMLFVRSKEPLKPSRNEVNELLSTALEFEVWPFSSNPPEHLQCQELWIVGDKQYIPLGDRLLLLHTITDEPTIVSLLVNLVEHSSECGTKWKLRLFCSLFPHKKKMFTHTL